MDTLVAVAMAVAVATIGLAVARTLGPASITFQRRSGAERPNSPRARGHAPGAGAKINVAGGQYQGRPRSATRRTEERGCCTLAWWYVPAHTALRASQHQSPPSENQGWEMRFAVPAGVVRPQAKQIPACGFSDHRQSAALAGEAIKLVSVMCDSFLSRQIDMYSTWSGDWSVLRNTRNWRDDHLRFETPNRHITCSEAVGETQRSLAATHLTCEPRVIRQLRTLGEPTVFQ